MLLGYGTLDEVRTYARRVIDTVARDGGYVLDASAIIQNDTRPENLRALTDTVREHDVYSGGDAQAVEAGVRPPHGEAFPAGYGLQTQPKSWPRPGVCVPWEEKERELPPITGDRDLVRRVWEQVDALGNTFIWQMLASF